MSAGERRVLTLKGDAVTLAIQRRLADGQAIGTAVREAIREVSEGGSAPREQAGTPSSAGAGVAT